MSVPYYGDFAEDDTVNIPFNTFTSDDPSASSTITDLVAGDIKIHKDGAVAEKASSDGVTVTINFDGITGNHLVTLDTSNDTGAAGFWVTGSEYQVRMEGTTVDGATVNAWIGAFSIERAGGALAVAKLIQAAVITNAAGADVAADIIAVKAETATIVGHTDKIDDGTDGLTAIKAEVEGLAGVAMRGTDNAALASVCTEARLAELDGANLPADVAAVPTAVEIQAEMEENGASILDTVRDDLADGGRLDLLIDAIKAKTDNLKAAWNDLSAAEVNAEVVDALNVDTYGEPGQEAPGATVSLVKKISYLYKAWRNNKDNDGTTRNLYGDDEVTVDQKSPVAEAAGTVTTDKWESGP